MIKKGHISVMRLLTLLISLSASAGAAAALIKLHARNVTPHFFPIEETLIDQSLCALTLWTKHNVFSDPPT